MQNIDAINSCLKAIGSQIMRENKECQVIILFTSSSQKERRISRSHNSTTESLYVVTESIYRYCTSSSLKNFNIKIDKRLGKALELNTHLQAQTYRDLIATK